VVAARGPGSVHMLVCRFVSSVLHVHSEFKILVRRVREARIAFCNATTEFEAGRPNPADRDDRFRGIQNSGFKERQKYRLPFHRFFLCPRSIGWAR
jgi:hypothetical protein